VRLQRIFAALALLIIAPLAWAEEAVEAASEAGPAVTASGVLATIASIAIAVVIPFLVRFLNGKAQTAKAEAKHADQSAASLLRENRRAFIDERVIPFIYATSAHLVDTRLPAIIRDATDGGEFDWKGHLTGLKSELLNLTKAKFAAEGVDIVTDLGSEYLGSLIERGINKAIPFLPEGIETTAKSLNEEHTRDVIGKLAEKGVDWVRRKWLTESTTDR